VELNTIGVDLQLRAAKVLRAVSDGYVDEDTDESSYICRLGESPQRRPAADRTRAMGWARVSSGDQLPTQLVRWQDFGTRAGLKSSNERASLRTKA
jgi:hypothetical protein